VQSLATVATDRAQTDSIKVWDLKTHFRHTSPGVVSLPEHFKNNGYFTQSIGKIFHGEPPMADPPSWSVPEAFQYTPKRDDYILEKNHVERIAQKADVDEFVDATDDAYPDGKVAAAAVDALSRLSKEKKPFFLAVGMRKPHLPFTAPKRYWDMFEGRRFRRSSEESLPRALPKWRSMTRQSCQAILVFPRKELFQTKRASASDKATTPP